MQAHRFLVRLDWSLPERAARLWKVVTSFVASRCDRFQIRHCWYGGMEDLLDPASFTRLAGLFERWAVDDPEPLEEALGLSSPEMEQVAQNLTDLLDSWVAELESRFGSPPVTLWIGRRWRPICGGTVE